MTEYLLNPAEKEAERAWQVLKSHLVARRSFLFEAGAGAGKTYSLIEALKFIVESDGTQLVRNRQRVACITFTNVARDEIIDRTDGHPAILCDTTHSFAWSLISGFQAQLRQLVGSMESWAERLAEAGDIGSYPVEYVLGRRGVKDGRILLHHDDIFPITIELLRSSKFRSVLASRFPIILIDEYQDTDSALVSAIIEHLLGQAGAPQIGFFGDHWQKIYGDGCGSIENAALARVEKGANFRSAKPIVDCLNRLRPELSQQVENPDAPGSVLVFHTNGWQGKRETRNHWQGDLPAPTADRAFSKVRALLTDRDGWKFHSDFTKVLMLTHRALATTLGYASLPKVFQYTDSFSKKSNAHIAYFVDHIEPAALAFTEKRYGAMFEAFGRKCPRITKSADKSLWSGLMTSLCSFRANGTVGEVIDHLIAGGLIPLPEEIVRLDTDLKALDVATTEIPRRLDELKKLRAVRYTEIIELARYLLGHSPFETKHGVKGAQFENVLGVFGRGWNDYNFNELLELIANPGRIPQRREAYERYRNLFYVVCSRPKTRLALLFTQKLSPEALQTAARVFGSEALFDIGAGLDG
jgi:DNA helicase-2/ATP-dependent DNA helicase PcrA